MTTPRHFWATELAIGHKCPRHLAHCSLNRKQRPEPSPALLKKFKYYKILETVCIYQLQHDDGWAIIKPIDVVIGREITREEQERVTYIKDGEEVLSGYVDLFATPPELIPKELKRGGIYEIKTSHPFRSAKTIDELLDDETGFTHGQIAQYAAYAYMTGRYGGLIYFTRDSSDTTIIEADLADDMPNYSERFVEFTHGLMESVDKAWSCLKQGVMPDYINDASVCLKCWCYHAGLCLPPMEFEGVKMDFIDTIEEDMILRRNELKPLAAEYDKLDKMIKNQIKAFIEIGGNPEQGFLIGGGRFHTQANLINRKGYTVEPTSYYRIAVTDLYENAIEPGGD